MKLMYEMKEMQGVVMKEFGNIWGSEGCIDR